MIDHSKAISALAKLYGLKYLHNPGGAAFSHPESATDCQIHEQDEKDDFVRLVEWLRANNAQIETDVIAASAALRNAIEPALALT